MTSTMTQTENLVTYNGWTNRETWNVVLWMENDEALYGLRCECESYEDFIDQLDSCGILETSDGVKWADPAINRAEINANVFDS